MTDTFNPDQASPLVGAAASTLRNWCKTYADHLSEGANPPAGTERRLTQQDVAKLQQVKVWRDERRSAQEIATLLQAAATASESAHLTIDVAPTPSTNAQDAPEQPLALQLVVSSLQAHSEAAQRRIATLEHELDAYRKRDLWTHGVAFYAGVVTMGAIFFFVWWLVNGF